MKYEVNVYRNNTIMSSDLFSDPEVAAKALDQARRRYPSAKGYRVESRTLGRVLTFRRPE